MAATPELTEDFCSFIKDLCGSAPDRIVADGNWHRFRIADTRSRSSTPGAYMLHADEHPVGLFMDWRRKDEIHRWRPGGDATPIDKEEARRLARERADKRRQGYADAATEALRYFRGCAPVDGDTHPYLARKRIDAHGARIGSGRPFGLGDEPCVVVPIRGPDNKALTVQAIRGDGERRFWKGSTTEGGYCLIGSTKADGPIILCEGFATGATLYQATGCLVIVCLSASNMVRISRWAGHIYLDRDFIVAGDDDWHLPLKPVPLPNEGREAATHAARNLRGRAVFPNMYGLATDGGDDFNDMAIEFGLDDVRHAVFGTSPEIEAAPDAPDAPDEPSLEPQPVGRDDDLVDFGQQPERPLLQLLSPSSWEGVAIPVREWRVQDFIPMRHATLFTGAGAVGKSLVNQQMTTCIGLGLPFLGVDTRAGASLYLTCEDDDEELHRRQAAICKAMRVDLSVTAGRVFLRSLYGEIGNALCAFTGDGKVEPSERYHQIVETCLQHRIEHVTLDNTAHLFTGNEIDRYEVASFMNLCNGMARAIGGTVIVVGHPNKRGDSYSGSTAWENQVRSRLFMESPVAEDGVTVDPDLRVIRNEKANYAQKGGELRFYWSDGAFVHEDEVLARKARKNNETVQQGRDNELFLRLLDQLTRERRNVSHAPNSGSYGPKVMAGMTDAGGVSKERFHAAMERLLHREIIAASQPLWIGKDRHPVHGIGRQKPLQPAPSAPEQASEKVENELRDRAGTCGTVNPEIELSA